MTYNEETKALIARYVEELLTKAKQTVKEYDGEVPEYVYTEFKQELYLLGAEDRVNELIKNLEV